MSEINKYVARLNTDQGPRVDSRKAVVATDGANKAVIYQDAATKQLVLEVLDEDGVVVATAGRVIVALDDAVYDGGADEIRLRAWDVCRVEGEDTIAGWAIFLSGPFHDGAMP